MFAIIIMLFTLFEVIFALWLILTLMKAREIVVKTNEETIIAKNQVLETISDYRISLRTLNKQTKNIKDEQKTKQIFELINLIGTFSFIFGLRKKKSL